MPSSDRPTKLKEVREDNRKSWAHPASEEWEPRKTRPGLVAPPPSGPRDPLTPAEDARKHADALLENAELKRQLAAQKAQPSTVQQGSIAPAGEPEVRFRLGSAKWWVAIIGALGVGGGAGFGGAAALKPDPPPAPPPKVETVTANAELAERVGKFEARMAAAETRIGRGEDWNAAVFEELGAEICRSGNTRSEIKVNARRPNRVKPPTVEILSCQPTGSEP
jgi:hypothetical protein